MLSLNFEQKARLKLNQIASQSAMARLAIAHNESNELSFYASSSELLMWIVASHDWHIQNGDSQYEKRMSADPKGVIIYGMRHAFNMIKHKMDFMYIHEKTTDLILPFSMDSVATVIYLWRKAGNELDGDRPKQKENYIKYLEGKEMFATYRDVMEFLNGENARYLASSG